LKYGPEVIVRKEQAKNKGFFTYFIDGINGKIKITVLKNALLKLT